MKKFGYESEKHASDKTSCRFVETTEWGCVVCFARDQRKSMLMLTHRRVSYCSEHAAAHRWILLASATVALVKFLVGKAVLGLKLIHFRLWLQRMLNMHTTTAAVELSSCNPINHGRLAIKVPGAFRGMPYSVHCNRLCILQLT